MTETEEPRDDETGEHPDLDRAYDTEEGGQIPKGQPYDGPDPADNPPGQEDDEDQAI
jgi:hypothetical protein